MNDIKLTVTINRPVREVFDFISNPSNTPKWVENIVKEEANESPMRAGTVVKSELRDGGRSGFKVAALEEGSMLEIFETGANYHVRYTFRELDEDRCELEYRVWNDDGNISDRFTSEKLQAILEKLKVVMETE